MPVADAAVKGMVELGCATDVADLPAQPVGWELRASTASRPNCKLPTPNRPTAQPQGALHLLSEGHGAGGHAAVAAPLHVRHHGQRRHAWVTHGAQHVHWTLSITVVKACRRQLGGQRPSSCAAPPRVGQARGPKH